MIDWDKVRNTSPEEREANIQKIRDRVAAKEASQRRMLDYLLEQDLPSWEHDFVHSLNARLLSCIPLSEKQDAKLTEVFERF